MNSNNSNLERFARSSYYLLLDSFTNLGIGAIFWVVLARIIDPSSIGQSMVVIAFATTVIGFSGNGVQVAIAKYVSEFIAKDMRRTAKRVFNFGLKIALIVIAITVMVLALLSDEIASMAYQNPSLSILLLLAVLTFIPSQTIISALIGAFQGTQKMKFVVMTDLMFQSLRILIAIILVFYGLGALGILIAVSIASVSSALASYLFLLPRAFGRIESAKSEDKQSIKQMVQFSGLNYANIGMRTLGTQIGMLVLGTVNFEWAAFFGLAMLASKVVGAVLNSTSSAMLPAASEQWVKGNREGLGQIANTAIRISLLISGFVVLVIFVDSEYFLGLISKDYVVAALSLRILIIGSIASALASVLASMLNGMDRATEVAKIGIFSSIVIISLTVILVPIMGFDGAAVAFLIGSIFGLILSLKYLRSNKQLSISISSLFWPCAPMIIAFFVGNVFVLLGNKPLGIAVALISYAALAIKYRVTTQSEVKQLLSILVRTLRA
jgi:stage V sporulation protein B